VATEKGLAVYTREAKWQSTMGDFCATRDNDSTERNSRVRDRTRRSNDRGWCGVTLGQEILASGCILRGEGVITENVADIVIIIVNDSASVVTIAEGAPVCVVYHTQRVRPA